MPAKELKLRFFKSLPRSARLSLLVALVPALCWGAYTVFGESGLIALALALPVLWVIYGGYESTTAVQSKQNGLNQGPSRCTSGNFLSRTRQCSRDHTQPW